MDNINEYYFLKANLINMANNSDVVEGSNSPIWSVDNSEFMIKTKEGIKNSQGLTPYTPLSQSEMIQYKKDSPIWDVEI
jgi:hypothetical protein